MTPKYKKGQTVHFTWQGKKIKAEILEIATEPGESLSDGGTTLFHVHKLGDTIKHAGQPLYKLKITDKTSKSNGKTVVHYEGEIVEDN